MHLIVPDGVLLLRAERVLCWEFWPAAPRAHRELHLGDFATAIAGNLFDYYGARYRIASAIIIPGLDRAGEREGEVSSWSEDSIGALRNTRREEK